MCSLPLMEFNLGITSLSISVEIRNVVQGAKVHKHGFLLYIQLATLYCTEYTTIEQRIKKNPSFPPGYFTFPSLWYHCLHESFIASELSNRVGLIRIEDFLGGMSVIS